MESHLEARLWNDIFVDAQNELAIPQGSIKATVLIETIVATFELNEILFELKEHSAGLNCGRWDYIFSVIKKFHARPEFVMPDRTQITMNVPFLKAYYELLIQTCHKRGAFAMGGMAAQIPIKDNPEKNAEALARVRADKLREVTAGHDGTWVAHPALIPLARELFEAGIDILTTGDHVWDQKEVVNFIGSETRLLRPLNYPPGVVGHGSVVWQKSSLPPVAIINLQGRTFMPPLDNPFPIALAEVERLRAQTPVIFVDFHAEATSEKIALARMLDGRVSGVVGTHTHVPTADAQVLPKGTAYQGNDYGTQYRSAIYYTTEEQHKIAVASMVEVQKKWKDPIATEIAPLKKFYPAEDYHQNFKALNPNQGYVRAVVDPKTEKFKHTLEEKGKIKPEAK